MCDQVMQLQEQLQRLQASEAAMRRQLGLQQAAAAAVAPRVNGLEAALASQKSKAAADAVAAEHVIVQLREAAAQADAEDLALLAKV